LAVPPCQHLPHSILTVSQGRTDDGRFCSVVGHGWKSRGNAEAIPGQCLNEVRKKPGQTTPVSAKTTPRERQESLGTRPKPRPHRHGTKARALVLRLAYEKITKAKKNLTPPAFRDRMALFSTTLRLLFANGGFYVSCSDRLCVSSRHLFSQTPLLSKGAHFPYSASSRSLGPCPIRLLHQPRPHRRHDHLSA